MKSKFPLFSSPMLLLKTCITAIFFASIAILAFSVLRNGYLYIFDIDELHHAHLVYLYAHGLTPYKDIYNSFYTPLFEWFISPVFLLFGFSFTTIYLARYIMILLFVVRMLSAFFLIQQLFSKRASYFFLPLFLFDPFVILTGMQIRPDNLMMTVYTVALLLFTVGMKKQSNKLLLTSATLFGLSLTIFMKVAPGIGITAILFVYYAVTTKKKNFLAPMMGMFILPILLFAFYGVLVGSIGEMIKQLILEAKTAYFVFRYPVPYGNYYQPNNIYVYGTMGTPLTWVYVWVLPLLGVSGLYHTLYTLITKKERKEIAIVKLIMSLTLIAQWVSLFFVQVAFLQHYLPINWLLALFAAVSLDDMLTALASFTWILKAVWVTLIVAFVALLRVSLMYNYTRSTIGSKEIIQKYETRWKQIPPSEPVFPGLLFRPSVYPIPFGYFIGNVPPPILNRLPPISSLLEQKKLPHLLIDDYTMKTLPADLQGYIVDHYTRVPGDDELMTRN